MTQEHPITPPLELVQQWRKSGPADAAVNNAYEHHIATQAARWGADQQLQLDAEQINQAWQKGADQELEACCEWLDQNTGRWDMLAELRAARRPKPPSLKEQVLETIVEMANCMKAGFIPKRSDLDAIRRAIEALPD